MQFKTICDKCKKEQKTTKITHCPFCGHNLSSFATTEDFNIFIQNGKDDGIDMVECYEVVNQ